MATDSRAKLLTAAEHLFAERGVDAVSLREITRASGNRNAIAVQYHFDDRAGVVQAILDKHLPDVDSRRHSLLDEIEANGTPTRRALAGALVRPLAAKLTDADGGPDFLQIYADLMNRPTPVLEAAEGRFLSLTRWHTMVQPAIEREAVRLHRRFNAVQHTAVELSRRARSGPHTDQRLFTSHLIDVVDAMLAAPLSDETRRILAERSRTRGA